MARARKVVLVHGRGVVTPLELTPLTWTWTHGRGPLGSSRLYVVDKLKIFQWRWKKENRRIGKRKLQKIGGRKGKSDMS